HSHYEKLDFEIRRRLPLPKHFKDSRLGILVLRRRPLRAFVPADHVFHFNLPYQKTDWPQADMWPTLCITTQVGAPSFRAFCEKACPERSEGLDTMTPASRHFHATRGATKSSPLHSGRSGGIKEKPSRAGKTSRMCGRRSGRLD